MTKLKSYKCHKVVHARQMTRGDYYAGKQQDCPDNLNPEDVGYLVVYSKGTEDEYRSWSPQKAFDEGYLPIHIPKAFGNPIMQYFAYEHLPENLKFVSEQCAALASVMDAILPANEERKAGLRKLLEAKDCFVRASLP